jgi:DNA-binding LytR/AlgR family response regulator
MIKCIAIDDQQSSIVGLEKYIEETPNMRLVGSYTDPLTALMELKKIDIVDVIFMDIQMPQISGLELSKAVRSKTRKLIFTTSHEEYAFEAFEADADAYLLKPYGYAKFALTLNRLFGEEMENREEETYFLVKNKAEEHKAVLVRYADIIAFESFHNYIKIHTKEKIIIAYLSLKDVKEQLSIKKNFIQLHRAYIIAIDHIQHIDGSRITLSNQTSFTVGDIYNNDFRDFITDKLIISSRKK